jgi:hypothetical protein
MIIHPEDKEPQNLDEHQEDEVCDEELLRDEELFDYIVDVGDQFKS